MGPLDDEWPAQRVVVFKKHGWIRFKRGTYKVVPFCWYKPWHWWARVEHWWFERKYWGKNDI